MFPFIAHRFPRRALAGPDSAGAAAPGRMPPAAGAGESVLARERRIDDELAQSFPASDPPSWVMGAVPVRH